MINLSINYINALITCQNNLVPNKQLMIYSTGIDPVCDLLTSFNDLGRPPRRKLIEHSVCSSMLLFSQQLASHLIESNHPADVRNQQTSEIDLDAPSILTSTYNPRSAKQPK
jgi:hypothetical protein